MTKQRVALTLFDALLTLVAVLVSFILRLEDINTVISEYRIGVIALCLAAMIVQPLVFWVLRLSNRLWRYASTEDLLTLLGGALMCVVISSAIAGVSLSALLPFPFSRVLPRSIPLILAFIAPPLWLLPRLILRLSAHNLSQRWRELALLLPHPTQFPKLSDKTRVIIFGAGDAGTRVARELRLNPRSGMVPVAFIDDNPSKAGTRLLGLTVYGDRNRIPAIASECGATCVVIAVPNAPGRELRGILNICSSASLQTKIVPSLRELLDGKLAIDRMRNIDIDDLLRRAPVKTDTAAVADLVRGKRVLVTGGGGSIGSELCRQLAAFNPAKLIVLGHGENSIFEIMAELTALRVNATPVIADIRFGDRIKAVFETHRPSIVFHAAAHKHVPLMEFNPLEAITNNIFGTRNLLNAALAADVDRFVMISTDKAVNPSSIMGASKRVAELLVHRAATAEGRRRGFVAVRFGNVLGSRGSVVLTFKKQIAAGGPVTITDPGMTRYFMTIPEAVQLVLQAATLGSGGEVFLLDMGEPVKIVDLARDLIRLAGLQEGRDVDIMATGMRPGEKLFEELFQKNEQYERTRHDKIFIAKSAMTPMVLNFEEQLVALNDAVSRNDSACAVSLIRAIVPEFVSPEVVDRVNSKPTLVQPDENHTTERERTRSGVSVPLAPRTASGLG